MNLVSISTGKFFKDNKIARARRASAIRSLWKVYRGLLHQIAREIILLLVNNVYEKKNHKKSRQTILWQRALAICNSHSCYKLVGTRVMDLYSRYLRMHSFLFFFWTLNEHSTHRYTKLIKSATFQAEEKEGRTPRCSSDNTSSMLRTSESATLSNGFVRDLTEERIEV